MALRLKNCLRQSDTVAHMGGDEFTVILTPASNPRAAAIFACKIPKIISEPWSLAGNEFVVSASIGISLYADAGTLLQKADMAMYRAKEKRNNTYRFYTDAYNEND